MNGRPAPYQLTCTQRADLSNNTVRYYVALNDGQTGQKIYRWFEFTSNMTIEAVDKTVTITLDPNGGTVTPGTMSFLAGSAIGELPTPTRNGYIFSGWSDAKSGTGLIMTPGSLFVEEDMTLYALWKINCTNHTYKAEICTVCGSKLSYDNSFDSSAAGTYQVSANTAYVRTGPYQEKNLVRTINKGETVQVTGSVVNSYGNLWLKTSEGYYVHAEKMALGTGSTAENHRYSVILDDGSTCRQITVTNGSTYGPLPVPAKEGHVFSGWYTASSGGTEITSSSIVNLTCDQILYAHWGHWGSWSNWTNTPYQASTTREVETRTVQISDAYTEYRYGRYVDNTGKNICWCGKYLESLSYVSGSASLQYSAWSRTRYSPNGKAWTCGYCNGDHIGIDHYDSAGRPAWLQYVSPSNDSYYWEESRIVDATYETQYRYRDWIID